MAWMPSQRHHRILTASCAGEEEARLRRGDVRLRPHVRAQIRDVHLKVLGPLLHNFQKAFEPLPVTRRSARADLVVEKDEASGAGSDGGVSGSARLLGRHGNPPNPIWHATCFAGLESATRNFAGCTAIQGKSCRKEVVASVQASILKHPHDIEISNVDPIFINPSVFIGCQPGQNVGSQTTLGGESPYS